MKPTDCTDAECHIDRERKMIPVERADGKSFSCDPCIAPIIRALNDAGIATKASCCGHGFRPGNIVLSDGREIVIAPDFAAARAIDGLFPVDINGVTAALATHQEEGACGDCDGTGNFYRRDEDGDFLACDTCDGTGGTPTGRSALKAEGNGDG